MHISNVEIVAAATAVQENSKYTRSWRCLHQTAPEKAASVRHAPAFIEQMTVIQFIEYGGCLTEYRVLRILRGEVSKKVKIFPNVNGDDVVRGNGKVGTRWLAVRSSPLCQTGMKTFRSSNSLIIGLAEHAPR
jgi:hypothetical protein